MKNFPQDTNDPIERAYAADVLSLFPNYGVFWRKFVGVRQQPSFPSRIFPYGLLFPNSFREDERIRVEQAYEETTMAHYSLFCHLAGAHFQIKQLEQIHSLSNAGAKLVEHWEAFEVTYLHLGIVFNEAHHLWDLLVTIMGPVEYGN